MKKQYFYTDKNGKVNRYLYCIRGCEQIYTQDQLGKEIFEIAKASYLCSKCQKELGIEKEVSSEPIQEDTEEIVEEKVPEVVLEKEEIEDENEVDEVETQLEKKTFALMFLNAMMVLFIVELQKI